MNDLFISEKNISLQKKSTTQVNAQCTLEIQLVQCLNLMTLDPKVSSIRFDNYLLEPVRRISACAAAKRAIGTRYGEQDT